MAVGQFVRQGKNAQTTRVEGGGLTRLVSYSWSRFMAPIVAEMDAVNR